MKMSSNNYTCKLPIVGSSVLSILNSEWNNNNVILLLLHDNQAWNGKIADDEDIADLIDQLSLTEAKYIEETRNALVTHGGAEHFAYTIDNDTFTWKKYVTKNMAVKFGYVTLMKVPVFDVFDKIIDRCLQANIHIGEKLTSAETQKETLEKENQLLKTKLNDLIEMKNEMETTLYSQFLCLLNEKKKKIKQLQKNLGLSNEDENEPDLPQSDSDPFGSDTELDSEGEDKKISSKVEIVETIGSQDKEEKSIFTLPKRSRRTKKSENTTGPSVCINQDKSENIAGPSRCVRRGKNNVNSKVQDCKDLLIPLLKSTDLKMGRGKIGRKSCVIGEVIDEQVKKNSEENTFMFPKRSKRLNDSAKVIKTCSKITYDSDDETNVSTSIKVESDSDKTPSDIMENISDRLKCENPKKNELENSSPNFKNVDKKNEEHVMNEENKIPNGKFKVTKNTDCEVLSSSTMDMLNQLM